MKLVLDAEGHVVLKDGNPVYMDQDGKEIALDAAATLKTIKRLNNEAQGHRERAQEYAEKLKPFEGIEDPQEAALALQTLKGLKQKTLVDSGEVETVKAELKRSYETQLAEEKKQRLKIENDFYNEKVGGQFARSKFINENMAIPPDFVEAKFRNQFKIEEGNVVAYDASGNRIYSATRPGEIATFDEALETLVYQNPHKDQLLRASGATGSGATQSGATSSNKTNRAQFDQMEPMQQAQFVRSGGQVTD